MLDFLHSITLFVLVAALMLFAKKEVIRNKSFRTKNRFWMFIFPFIYLFITLWIISVLKIKINKWLYLIIYTPFLLGESFAIAETQYRFKHKLHWGHVDIKSIKKRKK